ncbi:MAG: hypothetical protein QM831_11575 [Kofleriaceae bacterium]
MPEQETDPDGVPANIVGRVAYSTTLFAGIVLFALFEDGWFVALVASAIAIPVEILAISRESRRERLGNVP